MNRRLSGTQSQPWHFGEENNLLPPHKGKPKYKDKNLSQCHFIHHKSHVTAVALKLEFMVTVQQLTAWAMAQSDTAS